MIGLDTDPMTNGVSAVIGRPVESAVPNAAVVLTCPSRTIANDAPGMPVSRTWSAMNAVISASDAGGRVIEP